jgi:hypothetical protein
VEKSTFENNDEDETVEIVIKTDVSDSSIVQQVVSKHSFNILSKNEILNIIATLIFLSISS